MKFVTLALLAILSIPAFAFTYTCQGLDQNSAYSMALTEVGNTRVPENTPIDYQLVVKKNAHILFSGMVIGKQEDVMLTLRSRRGSPYMTATIFMDELDQTEMIFGANHEDIRFECDGE